MITVGILYPGEMGAAVASVLCQRGCRIVTTLQGRSGQSAARCRAAGMEVLGSLAEVVRASQYLISLVPPAAAEDVANACAGLAGLAPAGAVYVEANSIRPQLAAFLGQRLSERGMAFVDAAINGLAKNLPTTCTLYLSGTRAQDVAALFGDAVRTQVLGTAPGRASAMKMLLSALSKGICALFAETALLARQHGMLGEMIDAYARIYPGVMAIVERMLPTYARHAARRATETREVEEMAIDAGLQPHVLTAIREVHEALAGVRYDAAAQQRQWTVPALIEHLAGAQLLAATPAPP